MDLKESFTESFRSFYCVVKDFLALNPRSCSRFQTVTDRDGNTRFCTAAQINMTYVAKPVIMSTDAGHLKHPLWGSYQIMLPQAHHRYCVLHLLGNIKEGRAFTDADRELYWQIVTADTEKLFDEKMLQLKVSHPEAYKFLHALDPPHWSNRKCRGRLWGHLTNNILEVTKKLEEIFRFVSFFACSLTKSTAELRSTDEKSAKSSDNEKESFLNSFVTQISQ